MKAAIKSIKEISYHAIFKFGEISKGERSRESDWGQDTYCKYDENDNILEEWFFLKDTVNDEIPFLRKVFIYDLNGNLIEQIEYPHPNISNGNYDNTTWSRNEHGQLLEEVSMSFSLLFDTLSEPIIDRDKLKKPKAINEYFSIQSKTISKYNAYGKDFEVIEYDGDGNIVRKELTYFDENGNANEVKQYHSSDELSYSAKYKHNSKGQRTEVKRYENGDTLCGRLVFKYNKQGQLVEDFDYDSENKLETRRTHQEFIKEKVEILSIWKADGLFDSKWICKNDDEGCMLECARYNSEGSLSSKATYGYDGKGNELLISDCNFENGFECKTNIYEYDGCNNWIKKIEYKNEIPQYIVEREIEYY